MYEIFYTFRCLIFQTMSQKVYVKCDIFCSLDWWWMSSEDETLRTRPHESESKWLKPHKNICVHTNPGGRFWFGFTYPHEYARTTRIYLVHVCGHAQIHSRFENIRFRSSTRIRELGGLKKSTLESGFKKMRFRWAYSLVSCGRKTASHKNICSFKNIRIRVDGVLYLQQWSILINLIFKIYVSSLYQCCTNNFKKCFKIWILNWQRKMSLCIKILKFSKDVHSTQNCSVQARYTVTVTDITRFTVPGIQ